MEVKFLLDRQNQRRSPKNSRNDYNYLILNLFQEKDRIPSKKELRKRKEKEEKEGKTTEHAQERSMLKSDKFT